MKITKNTVSKGYARLNIWPETKVKIFNILKNRNKGKKGKDRETIAGFVDAILERV